MLKLLSERYPNSKQLEDLAACRSHLQGGSRSFYAASLFLPQPMGHHACGLYAFCREADDVIDEGDDQWAALESLKSRLDAIYAGEPYSIAADRAVAAVVAERNLIKDFSPKNENKSKTKISELSNPSTNIALFQNEY